MKAHIVLAHPEARSFNGQLARLSAETLQKQGYETSFSDLYSMNFDPCEGPKHFEKRADSDVFHAQSEQRHNADNHTLPDAVEMEINHLLSCDLLVVHFPLWWFGPPAILKGWMDRVFAYGRMYRSAMRYDAGICRGKKMIACVTTGASADSCAHNGREGDTHMHLWPIMFPFRYVGFDVFQPEIFHAVGGVAFLEDGDDGLRTIDDYFSSWTQSLSKLSERELVSFNSDDDFDANKRLLAYKPQYSPFIRHNEKPMSGTDKR